MGFPKKGQSLFSDLFFFVKNVCQKNNLLLNTLNTLQVILHVPTYVILIYLLTSDETLTFSRIVYVIVSGTYFAVNPFVCETTDIDDI